MNVALYIACSQWFFDMGILATRVGAYFQLISILLFTCSFFHPFVRNFEYPINCLQKNFKFSTFLHLDLCLGLYNSRLYTYDKFNWIYE
ncbi:hypothetical protein Pfo_002442 [Paulownia fortunei]|nr:hypothetical protein Pfo_002442 [Paulownia fortunei]